jgi:TonB-dependent SusC/RagA subfamily outer membrane receptor
LAVFVLMTLSGCALTRPPENDTPDPDAVDVGYGTVDKDHVTGSVATIHPDSQQVVNHRTLVDMLMKIPGVVVGELPGGGMRVRIRGTNSFLAGEEPLWVVDGMIYQTAGGFTEMNPNNIASITVLKDAGSTAIYGARGANGVILIKTKTGGR